MDPFTIGIGRFEVELTYLEVHTQFVHTSYWRCLLSVLVDVVGVMS